MVGRHKPAVSNGHVVDYHHVIHAMSKKRMALLDLVYAISCSRAALTPAHSRRSSLSVP